MDDIRKYFEVLGIKPNASIEEIKQAYKDLVKVWHPDRFVNDPRFQRKAEEKLKEINEAYQKIQDYLNDSEEPLKTDESDTEQQPKEEFNQKYEQTDEPDKNKSYQPPPKEQPSSPDNAHKLYVQRNELPRPWIRYFARMLDLNLFAILIGLFSFITFPEFTNRLKNNWSILGALIFFLPLMVLFEAIIIAIFGNTPGKAILNIKIANRAGENLNFTEALKRVFYLYIHGLGMGMPILSQLTCLQQYFKLKKDGKTSWDKKFNYSITHSRISTLRGISFITLLAFSLIFFLPQPQLMTLINILGCQTSYNAELRQNPEKPVMQTENASTYTEPITGMEFVFVKGGCYWMGDTFGDGLDNEKPVHEVCVDDFWMGKYEVTVGEFRKFVNETGYRTDAEKGEGCVNLVIGGNEKWISLNWNNPGFAHDDRHPIVCVSWNDANAFIEWQKMKTGKSYRLPTEAEWEYAARSGGKKYKYSWGNGSPSGNILDESFKKAFPESPSIWGGYDDGFVYTAPVGTYRPNEIGLYDMSGNVLEWSQDWYGGDYYKNSPRNNPQGPSSGEQFVVRGDCWLSAPSMHFSTSSRFNVSAIIRAGEIGFRCAKTP